MLTIDNLVNLTNYSSVISAPFNTFTPLATFISIVQNSTDYGMLQTAVHYVLHKAVVVSEL